jgi:hypothetical protein
MTLYPKSYIAYLLGKYLNFSSHKEKKPADRPPPLSMPNALRKAVGILTSAEWHACFWAHVKHRQTTYDNAVARLKAQQQEDKGRTP